MIASVSTPLYVVSKVLKVPIVFMMLTIPVVLMVCLRCLLCLKSL